MAGGLAQPGGKKTFAVRGVAGEGLQRTLQEGLRFMSVDL